MPYLVVDDFSAGIDLRKSNTTAKAGTLRDLRNGFVSAGGEIVKRKTFTSVGTLPPSGTHGLGFTDDQLVVFGTDAPGGIGALPANTTYKQLTVSDGATISRVLDVDPWGSKLYVIARFNDGTTRHFFDGTQVAAMTNKGTVARTHKSKMYVGDGDNLRFSAVGAPNDFAGTGSGTIDVTQQDAATGKLVGIEQYYGKLALFGRNAVQLWVMDPDPAVNNFDQVLGNIGLVSPNAVSRYGNGDVLFLSQTGIRSLRARDSSNAAVLNDIGSPIDDLIAAKRAVLTPAVAERQFALVDPLTGQFWLVWGNEVHVLAYYPNSKVTAWSTFTLPWSPDHVTLANQRIVFRVGNECFIYGSVPSSGSPFDPNAQIGLSAAVYDGSAVTIITPMLDLGKPAHAKTWQGLDMSASGVWEVYVAPDHQKPDSWTKIATVTDPTFQDERIPIDMGESTHIAVKLVSTGLGPAQVNSFALHHNLGEAE